VFSGVKTRKISANVRAEGGFASEIPMGVKAELRLAIWAVQIWFRENNGKEQMRGSLHCATDGLSAASVEMTLFFGCGKSELKTDGEAKNRWLVGCGGFAAGFEVLRDED
jgi:hypothetical protein